MMKKYYIVILMTVLSQVMYSQIESDSIVRMKIDDEWMYAIVTETDTLFLADLEGSTVTMPRTFESLDDKRYYYKLKRSAQIVYPYAIKAIEIYRETQDTTQNMKKRKKKKYTKKRQKELKEEFEEPLKKLTKTQGKVLIAMIERELDTSFYNVVKEIRNGFTATKWNILGKVYGYKLKKKYDPKDDPIMEAVLTDFDIDLGH